MRNYPRYITVVFVLALILLGLSITFFYRQGYSTHIRQDLSSSSGVNNNLVSSVGLANFDSFRERNRWSYLMDEIGTAHAYEEYKKEYEPYPFEIQHTVAHLIGELLYEKEGIDGLGICDESFAFGCYHSFFGRALSNEGISVIPDLDRVCFDKYGLSGTGCTHGIGHGILEYFGHDKLLSALDFCSMTTQEAEHFGCTSGVFMEYNFQTVFSSEEVYTSRRALNPDNPHEPCNTIIPEKFRKSCYFEMGLWWAHSLGGDFEKLGKLCQEVSGREYRISCYSGMGKVVAPSSSYDVGEIVATCKKMPSLEGEDLCKLNAAWRLFSMDKYTSRAKELCGNVTSDLKDQCPPPSI